MPAETEARGHAAPVYAASYYNETSRALVLAYKHGGRIALSRLRIVGNPLLLDSNYFAIARAHPEAEAIMARINAAISRMKAERSLQRQLDDYRARY